MKVKKTYGVIADRGVQAIKFCLTDEGLGLVGYKDGMAIRNFVYTKDEFKKIRDILTEYLGITDQKEDEIVSCLTTISVTDSNFKTALEKATAEQIAEAIKIVTEKGGRNKTKLTTLEGAKDRIKPTAKAKPKAEAKKEEPKSKVVEFPLDDKKPKIIPLKTEGNATYEECEKKLEAERKMFHDFDSEFVIDGLLEACQVDPDFRNNLMRKDKSYGGFMEFMFKAAQNGYCVKYGNVGWISREDGLQLALDYYNHDEEKAKAEAEKKHKEEEAKRKAEAEKKKKEAKANGKTNGKKKSKTA